MSSSEGSFVATTVKQFKVQPEKTRRRTRKSSISFQTGSVAALRSRFERYELFHIAECNNM